MPGAGRHERARLLNMEKCLCYSAVNSAGAQRRFGCMNRQSWLFSTIVTVFIAAASVSFGGALPPPSCHGGKVYIAERRVRVLRLRGHGDAALPSYLTSGSSTAPHTASAKSHLPAISKGDTPLENAGASTWMKTRGGHSRFSGTPVGHDHGFVKESMTYDPTKLTASVTPRQAQRQREFAASPAQLSPASPVTEDEASSVLQRVNKAVSGVHWEQEVRTPVATSRQVAQADEHAPVAQASLKTLEIEREAVFNTPLPPGARAAAHRAPKQAFSRGMRQRPEDASGLNARLFELAMRQKGQLERMLAEQQKLNATNCAVASSASHPSTRASRTQILKPLVKVSLGERSVGMGLDLADGAKPAVELSQSHARGAGGRGVAVGDRGQIAGVRWGKPDDSQMEPGGHVSWNEGSQLEGSQEVSSSGDPARFLNALDAHCEGLRTALADIEAEMTATKHHQTPCQQPTDGGAPSNGISGLAWQSTRPGFREAQGSAEARATGTEKECAADEEPRHNHCFSPLPTVSPSVDHLALPALELSPLLSAPALQQQQQFLLRQRQPQQPQQPQPLQQQQQRQQLRTDPNAGARGQDCSKGKAGGRHPHHHRDRSPEKKLLRRFQGATAGSSHAKSRMASMLVLAAGVLGRGFTAPLWASVILAAANIAVGMYLIWRAASVASARP